MKIIIEIVLNRTQKKDTMVFTKKSDALNFMEGMFEATLLMGGSVYNDGKDYWFYDQPDCDIDSDVAPIMFVDVEEC